MSGALGGGCPTVYGPVIWLATWVTWGTWVTWVTWQQGIWKITSSTEPKKDHGNVNHCTRKHHFQGDFPIVVCFRYWYASDFWEPNQAERTCLPVSTWCPTPGLPSCSSQLSLASLHSYSCWLYYGFSAFLYWLLHDYCAKKNTQSWFVKNPEIRNVRSENVPKIPIYLFILIP